MQLVGSVPVLACSNIDTTLDFYQQALQFIIVKQRRSEEGLQWVYLKSGDVMLMLEAVASQGDAANANSRLYFFTDDVETLHHFLKARGYRPGEIRTTPYAMREFDIRDPENHSLTIGRRLSEK